MIARLVKIIFGVLITFSAAHEYVSYLQAKRSGNIIGLGIVCLVGVLGFSLVYSGIKNQPVFYYLRGTKENK